MSLFNLLALTQKLPDYRVRTMHNVLIASRHRPPSEVPKSIDDAANITKKGTNSKHLLHINLGITPGRFIA